MATSADEVARLVQESMELRRSLQCFAAMARLARVEVLSSVQAQPLRAEVASQLAEINLSDNEIKSIRASAADSLEKAIRVLTVGGDHTFEELVWIVTLRTEFWLVENFMHKHGYADLEISSAAVDNAIIELSQEVSMRRRLESADRHVRKHGKISLVDVGILNQT